MENVKCGVPELSRFFGIIIRMYQEAGERHHAPHFHAYYQEDSAIFSVEPIEMARGGYRHVSVDSSKLGLNFTNKSS
jgi:Domain of unknown function (DUF4160)